MIPQFFIFYYFIILLFIILFYYLLFFYFLFFYGRLTISDAYSCLLNPSFLYCLARFLHKTYPNLTSLVPTWFKAQGLYKLLLGFNLCFLLIQ